MPCYAFEGLVPVVDPSAYVHPTAVLIGDVHIGAGCYIGPLASLRGDFGRIEIQAGANFQDCCVAHSFPNHDVVVEVDGHIGHGAVLHGCRVARNALVGMNAVVMDGALIGEDAVVAACAFVPSGAQIAARSLAVGSPARVIRALSDDDVARKSEGTRIYQQLAERCRASLHETAPLPQAEPGRQRLVMPPLRPLSRRG